MSGRQASGFASPTSASSGSRAKSSMHGVGDAGLKAWREITEFTLDGGGRNREQAMNPNRRPNLETRLSEAGILRIENDIGVQRIVWCAAGYEGQHDVTV